MIAEYKGNNSLPPVIPPEVMAQMRYRVLIGHAGPNRSTVLCGDHHWNSKNNRWTLEYALTSARVQHKDKSQQYVSTLYESMVIIGHPMTIVPMKSTTPEGRHNATTQA